MSSISQENPVEISALQDTVTRYLKHEGLKLLLMRSLRASPG